ncbi:hypothetical protein [Candidatus Sodalis sp. SoCistrobi]|uniref:hypothetical protein n=1 Tax=Candidatus Sodalis sp. SoCistrobi TaxID=1922216 RepID=UPI0009395A3A|nr:hypothetical protein [Candidatus Sodalis sp. SoCistrobi]
MPRIKSVEHEAGLGALRPEEQRGATLRAGGIGGQGVNVSRLDLVLRITPEQLQRWRLALPAADENIARPKPGEFPVVTQIY